MKVRDREFWKNKKVLVTGFEGFLGSNLVKALLERKVKVIGLDIKTFRKETILCLRDYKKQDDPAVYSQRNEYSRCK